MTAMMKVVTAQSFPPYSRARLFSASTENHTSGLMTKLNQLKQGSFYKWRKLPC